MEYEVERRYRSLLEQYSKLLQDWLELSQATHDSPHFPPFPPVAVVNSECPLRQRDPDLLRLLVAPGERSDGLREVRDFTAGVKRLTILDPYFFSGKVSRAKAIAQDFAKTARLAQGQLKALHVVRNEAKDTTKVLGAIRKLLKDSGVRLTLSSTDELHDRVWIADGVRAVVVGTSFNGLGTRAAFILSLPKADLDAILEFLHDRRLSPRQKRRASPEKRQPKA